MQKAASPPFSSLSYILALYVCLFAYLSLLLFTIPDLSHHPRQVPEHGMKMQGEGKRSVNKALSTYLLEPVILSAQS